MDKTKNLRGTKLWYAFYGMKQRCLNPNNPKYPSYGGRGIKICAEWINDIQAFVSDMGEPPSKSHSLGRIDNDGPYGPENCRWETSSQQANNRRKPSSYHRNPNSLANLRPMTSEWGKEIWDKKRAHQKSAPKTCETCGSQFIRKGKPKGKHVYCSRKCYGLSIRDRKQSLP